MVKARLKINEVVGKKIERPQRQGMWFVTNNTDLHSIEWELIMFMNIRVLRLCSTDWKLSLMSHSGCLIIYLGVEKIKLEVKV